MLLWSQIEISPVVALVSLATPGVQVDPCIDSGTIRNESLSKPTGSTEEIYGGDWSDPSRNWCRGWQFIRKRPRKIFHSIEFHPIPFSFGIQQEWGIFIQKSQFSNSDSSLAVRYDSIPFNPYLRQKAQETDLLRLREHRIFVQDSLYLGSVQHPQANTVQTLLHPFQCTREESYRI